MEKSKESLLLVPNIILYNTNNSCKCWLMMSGVMVLNKCIIQYATWEYLFSGKHNTHGSTHPLVWDFPLKRWPPCRLPDTLHLQTCTLCVLQYLTLFTHLIHLLCLPVTDCIPLAFLFFVTSFPSYLFPHFHNHGNIVRLNRLNYFHFFVTSDALFCYNVFFSWYANKRKKKKWPEIVLNYIFCNSWPCNCKPKHLFNTRQKFKRAEVFCTSFEKATRLTVDKFDQNFASQNHPWCQLHLSFFSLSWLVLLFFFSVLIFFPCVHLFQISCQQWTLFTFKVALAAEIVCWGKAAGEGAGGRWPQVHNGV